MPSNKDYYAILGVSKTASDDEIKKAFRRLAHEHHPDKGGDQQKFKDVNEAYQILGDKEKRARYDQFGSAAFDPNSGFGQGGFGGGFGGFDGMNMNFEDFGDLGDILGGMFGFESRRGPKQKRGSDIETEVTIDFLESVQGVSKKVKLYKHDPCSVCTGTGGEPGAKMETCATCSGRGVVQKATRTIFGSIQSSVACPDCQGRGQKPTKPCTHCKGTGIERKTVELDIPIPPGVSDGDVLRVEGAGEYPGPGGKSGDLFIRVRVKQHATFTRDGNNVRSTVHIPFSMMSLGGEIEIDTVDGKGVLRIPEATEPGTVFQIRQKGFSAGRSGSRGDHLVTVQPHVQKKPSKEQRKALEDLRNVGL